MRVKLFFVILFLCIVGLFVRAQLTTFPVTGGGSGATTVAGISDAGTAAYSNATAFALAQSGTIVTQNNSFSLVLSNDIKLDAAHALSLSNATASRIAIFGADKTVGSSTASGAVPIDADGTATTFAQIDALAPGFVVTNGAMRAITNNAGGIYAPGSDSFSTGFLFTNTTTGVSAKADGSEIVLRASGTVAIRTSGGLVNLAGAVGFGGASASAAVVRFRPTSTGIDLDNTVNGGYTNLTLRTLLMPTNYVAAAFTPVSGMAFIACSNGIYYKVTQQSTNLLNSTVP